jgi:hypothetical protein
MKLSRSMLPRSSAIRERHTGQGLGALTLAIALSFGAAGCGNGSDYYFLSEIKGEGDTVLLNFLFTCGQIDLTWDGSFGALPHHQVELVVQHDDGGDDCGEGPRDVPYDVGPMKRSFRAEHPWPTPLGLRVAPFEEEQSPVCLRNLFLDAPFKGQRCK